MPSPPPERPLLVLDTASPVVSVAIGTPESVAAVRTLELRRSSELLLRAVEEALEEAGLTLRELGGVAALQGPGSFTGLRIGLATVLGWHQALGLLATALPTLPVLAAAGRAAIGRAAIGRAAAGRAAIGLDVVAAVDAMRGDWYVERFPADPSRAGEEPGLLAGEDLNAFAPCRLVGFGVSGIAGLDAAVDTVEPPPLAPVALALAAESSWDAARLSAPVYFRPPAVTKPKRRRLGA